MSITTKIEDSLGNEDLKVFQLTLADFNQKFSQAMYSGTDFTLKLEVRGDGGKLLHCRCSDDNFRRPSGQKKSRNGQ